MALWLGMGAFALAALGILAVVRGLRTVSAEFSTRYARSMQQFRGDEQGHQELLRGLSDLAAGDLSQDVAVSTSGDYAAIAARLNDVLHVVRERFGAAGAALSAGADSGDQALELVEGAQSSSAQVAQSLSVTAGTLDDCDERSTALALDSRALRHAAAEASARSSDATRVAQDAASRLEALREGLQETSKRIKRLGERSQEINEVVDALEVLSEQIGVVALNASLEAERAGDAGAGFRIVAREVQQLATRSQHAMEKISGLVQGVQADARSAGESVERSTVQVVTGANVGAVSHSLLSVLAPLAESIGSMADVLAEQAETTAAAVAGASAAARQAHEDLSGVVTQVAGLRKPLGDGRRHIDSGLQVLADSTTEEAII
jgi:twitching motility protein PilJ